MTTREDSHRKAILGAVTLILLALVVATPSFAQTAAQRNDALMTQLQRANPQLGAQDKYISGGLRNALNIIRRWDTIEAGLEAAAAQRERPLSSGVTATGLASRETGFTQSETSTAWCGTNAVIGFNDTGSLLETEAAALAGTSGLSLMGYAQSTNANSTTTTPTFADKGPLPAGPVVSGMGLFVSSDPVVGCASASDFFLSGIGFDCSSFVLNGGVTACGAAQSNVTVSASTDGGATFNAPKVAIAKTFPDHVLDKDWMTVDSAHGEIYVTYTDIDNSAGNICGTDIIQIQRVAIELVSSSNGGATWSAPTEVTHVCADQLKNPNTSVTGSQIAVAPLDGSVYVAWESIGLGGGDPTVREIDIAKSPLGGASFGAPTKITNVNCAGDCADGTLQGGIRILEFPSLVMGKGTHSGKLFMAWNDGDNPQPDALITTYNFTDVKLVSSSDGVTWSAPAKANINAVSNTDHFQPTVSSDKSSRIAVCFYDRRNDPNNFLIDRYCANSANGTSFTNSRITTKSFASVVSQDALSASGYMGDYDTLAADTMNSVSGFRGAFANNINGAPNVQSNKF